MKRKFSILLCVSIIFTMLPMNAYAKSSKAETDQALTVTGQAVAVSNETTKVTSGTTKVTSGTTKVTSGTTTVTGGAITVTDDENATGKLEKAILAVKSKITIPKTLTEFDYEYNTDNSSSYWYLSWSNEDNSKRIIVNCDDNQNIIRYYNSTDAQNGKMKPTYLKSELKGTADKFIKKIAPDISNKIEYVESSFDSVYSGEYRYQYTRIENGIPMPDNDVTVYVNYETGKVVEVNINWLYNLTIPSKDTNISSVKAAEKIGNNLTMELAYENYYDTDANGNMAVHAYLVYEPDKSYVSVDAKTGEVYLTKEEYNEDETATSEESNMYGSKDCENEDSSGLTEKEIESLTNLKGLITKKEAISKITNQDTLLLDKSLKTVTASLTQTYDSNNTEKKSYIWNLNFTDPRSASDDGESTYIPYAYATVDAKTGKILSFQASVESYYDISEDKWKDINVKYSLKQCQATFENFAKEQMSEHFSNTQLSAIGNDYIIAYKEDKPVYGGYNYNYNRVNENIIYPYNGINGSVDGVTGKIYEFNSEWDDTITFESPQGVISPKEAFNQYISKDGYGLVYEVNTITNYNQKTNTYSEKNEVRLVYRADIYPSTISPFTGKQIDNEGKAYTSSKAYSYTDIASCKYERAIRLLADMGIGFEGDKFLPDQQITKGELDTLLSAIDYSETTLSNDQKKEKITRMDAVKRLITYAGYEKIAELKNMYAVAFTDLENVPDSYIGYIALAKGLGIVDGDKFRPTDNLTRSEAAYMIINLLTAQSKL